MFIIVYDELLKEKITKDHRFAYLYSKNEKGKSSYVFCLADDKEQTINFENDDLFEYGLNDNSKYRLTQILTL